jgi:hypothetical protein
MVCLRQVEEPIMKSLLLATTVATIAVAAYGTASAGDAPQRALAPITVQSGQRVDCTPPSAAPACAALHAQIRRHFTRREFGMLFGARTSYPESLTSYQRVNERFHTFVRDFAANEEPSVAVAAR